MAAHIRFAKPTDAAGILAIYGPYCESTCVSFEIVAPTIEQIQERIGRITRWIARGNYTTKMTKYREIHWVIGAMRR